MTKGTAEGPALKLLASAVLAAAVLAPSSEQLELFAYSFGCTAVATLAVATWRWARSKRPPSLEHALRRVVEATSKGVIGGLAMIALVEALPLLGLEPSFGWVVGLGLAMANATWEDVRRFGYGAAERLFEVFFKRPINLTEERRKEDR